MLRVQIALRVFCLALLAGAPILAHGPHELAAPEQMNGSLVAGDAGRLQPVQRQVAEGIADDG